MLPRTAPLLTLLLLLPAASAGGYDASVDYLEPGANGCDASAWSYTWRDRSPPSNGSEPGEEWSASGYGHGHDATCWDSLTYASVRVSDDEGDVAFVRAGSMQSSHLEDRQGHTQWTRNGTQSSSHAWSGRNASGDARTVNATTREGAVFASDGCQRGWSGHASSYSQSGEKGWQEGASGSGSAAESCRTLVGARVGDERVLVAPAEESCSSWWSRGSGQSQDAFGGAYGWEQRAYQDDCRQGASAQAGDTRLAAGAMHACHSQQGASAWGEGNATEGSSYQSRGCQDGVIVEGPDGIVVFAGRLQDEWSSCRTQDGQTSCAGEEDDRRLVLVSWAHGPLGPAPVVIPLP